MDITGKIIAALPERSGVSQRSGSEWKAASYVLETQEQYPKKICFDVFGADRIEQFNIQVGDVMTVSFDIDAHEYNGRWFNSIRAFRVNRDVQATAPAEVPMPDAPAAPFNAEPASASPFDEAPTGDSDLPF